MNVYVYLCTNMIQVDIFEGFVLRPRQCFECRGPVPSLDSANEPPHKNNKILTTVYILAGHMLSITSIAFLIMINKYG